jgi:hypothetical protein
VPSEKTRYGAGERAIGKKKDGRETRRLLSSLMGLLKKCALKNKINNTFGL